MNIVLRRTNARRQRSGYIDRAIGRAAIRSLYSEVALYPKPGLVSPRDSGAHVDMTMATFMRSLFSLRDYFVEIAAAGAAGAVFPELQVLGRQAEERMLRSTSGINTHRGAIFNLGLLSAASGYLLARGIHPASELICETVQINWGHAILASTPAKPSSNGLRALAEYGGRGARQEAAEGYPILRTVTVPVLKATFSGCADRDRAAIEALFATMAVLDDTNLLHRGGAEGLEFVKQCAREFLSGGGVFRPDFIKCAETVHNQFTARRLSPGGAADMLACANFLVRVESSLWG